MRLLFFVLISISLASCSKYDEGKASWASKKSRLVNNWAVVSITANGYDVTSLNNVTNVEIKNDQTITVTKIESGTTVKTNGTWKFNGDKTEVVVTHSNGSVDNYYIIKLEKDSLKLSATDDNGILFIHEYKSA